MRRGRVLPAIPVDDAEVTLNRYERERGNRGEGKRTKELRGVLLRALDAVDGSVTSRQLFYLAVSSGAVENTKAECRRVGRLVVTMRRDGSIPYARIVDRTRAKYRRASWDGMRDVLREAALQFALDHWLEQPAVPMIACEKQALEGIFESAVEPWGVPLYVIRGFDSETFDHEWADDITEITESGRDVVIYYFGDHDPSGLCVEATSKRKLEHFGARFTWKRAGLLWADFERYKLVNVPVKKDRELASGKTRKGDPRAKGYLNQFGDRAAELDALHPDELRARIDRCVKRHVDFERWNATGREEQVQKEGLEMIAQNWKAALAGAKAAGAPA